MVRVCLFCGEIEQEYEDVLDEDIDVDLFICEDCFLEYISEPFCFSILKKPILFYTDKDFDNFMLDLYEQRCLA